MDKKKEQKTTEVALKRTNKKYKGALKNLAKGSDTVVLGVIDTVRIGEDSISRENEDKHM